MDPVPPPRPVIFSGGMQLCLLAKGFCSLSEFLWLLSGFFSPSVDISDYKATRSQTMGRRDPSSAQSRSDAVTVSYASGNAGGIFGPSLFIGAMLGGTVGSVAHRLLPGYTGTPGAYALVGMGTAFAGIVRAPMTSVVMIFEVTRNYAIIVPLMISNLVSFFISAKLQRQPIYEALAIQDGIHLPRPEVQRYAGRRVAAVMRAAREILPAETTVQEALERVQAGEFHSWPVMDERGVVGVDSAATLQKALSDSAGARTLAELMSPAMFPHVHSDQLLHQALERMGAAGLDALPVVSRANVHQLEGVVVLSDILDAYGVAHHDT